MRPGEYGVIALLNERTMLGSDLRTALGWSSSAAFYYLMSSMEQSGNVQSWWEAKIIDGIELKEKRYRLSTTF